MIFLSYFILSCTAQWTLKNKLAWETLQLFSQILKSFSLFRNFAAATSGNLQNLLHFVCGKISSCFKSSQDILLNVFLPADAADRKRHEKQGKISGSRRGLFSGDLAEPEKLISLINAAACNSFHVFIHSIEIQLSKASGIFCQDSWQNVSYFL